MSTRSTETETLFLHIGLHRTGTTFLRRDVFPRIEGVYREDWNGVVERRRRSEAAAPSVPA